MFTEFYRHAFFISLACFVFILATNSALEGRSIETGNLAFLASLYALAPNIEEALIPILTTLYGVGGVINIVGYIPTIRDLMHHKPSANVSTYVMWAFVALAAFLYGLFVLKDLFYNVVIGAQLAIIILVLTLLFKIRYAHN